MWFEYLLFNLVVIIGPVMVLVYSKKAVKMLFRPAFFSIMISALVFLVWDHFATGVFWNFNSQFISGYKITNLPFEEVLFFITVPVGCLLLYVNILKNDTSAPGRSYRMLVLSSALMALAAINMFYFDWPYTGIVIFALSLVIILDSILLRTRLLLRKSYYKFLAFVLALTLVFNYYLTARPVVIYEPSVKSGIYIFTIPLEDFIYSITFLLLVTVLYEYFKGKARRSG